MIQPFAFVNSWTAKKESEQAGESFGLTLIPLVIGLALLSFDGRSTEPQHRNLDGNCFEIGFDLLE